MEVVHFLGLYWHNLYSIFITIILPFPFFFPSSLCLLFFCEISLMFVAGDNFRFGMGATTNGLGASNKSEEVKRKARAERYFPCLNGLMARPV